MSLRALQFQFREFPAQRCEETFLPDVGEPFGHGGLRGSAGRLRAGAGGRRLGRRPAALDDVKLIHPIGPAVRSLCRPPARLSMARAGIFDSADESWSEALETARLLPDDMLGPFLLLARAARERAPCPSDEEIAASYGTASLGRARRLLSYIESRELIVTRVDLSGKRSIAIPRLGWATAAA